MRIRLTSCLLAVMLCSVGSALAAINQSCDFAVTGIWQPAPGDKDSGQGGWQALPQGFRLTTPISKTQHEFRLMAQEPLPDGDWTVDIWSLYLDERMRSEPWMIFYLGERHSRDGYLEVQVQPDWDRAVISIFMELPNNKFGHGGGYDYACGAGPIHWLQISYSRQRKRLAVCINGQPVKCDVDDVVLPRGPVAVGVLAQARQTQSVLEIRSLQVSGHAELDWQSVKGIAFDGWRTPLRADLGCPGKDLDQVLQRLCDATLSEKGQAYALAAAVLAERARSGRVSQDTWQRVAALVGPSPADKREAASILLPIALASADPMQKAEAEKWVGEFFQQRSPRDRLSSTLYPRTALLDLGLTSLAALDRSPSFAFRVQLMKSVSNASPRHALALLAGGMDWGSDHPAVPWVLPEAKATSTNFYRLATEWIMDQSHRQWIQRGEPDRTLSFASYRLAGVEPALSLQFWGLITDPGVKADTLEYMVPKLPPDTTSQLDLRIESLLKEAVEDWKPSKKGDSPVSSMVRLGRWYISRQRQKDAAAVVLSACEKRSEAPSVRFRDMLDLARLAKELGLSQANDWWNKAHEYALAEDAERTEPDDSGMGIYISAVSLMVRDLVKEGRIDEAMAMLPEMSADIFPLNRAICMSAIVQKLADSDPDRAAEFVSGMTPGSLHDSAAAMVARKLARKDTHGALALVNKMRPPARLSALLQIAEAVDVKGSQEWEELCREAVSAALAPERQRPGYYLDRSKLSQQLAHMPLSFLVSLEPSFRGNEEFYGAQLLIGVAEAAGLGGNPIWKLYVEAERAPQGGNPWGVDSLKYAVLAESPEPR